MARPLPAAARTGLLALGCALAASALSASGLSASEAGSIPTPMLLVNALGWTVAHNLTTLTTPVDGTLLLDGGGSSLLAMFHNLGPAALLAPFHLVAGPAVAPGLAVVSCLVLSAWGHALLGHRLGLAGVGALVGVSAPVLTTLVTGRMADGLGGLVLVALWATGAPGVAAAGVAGAWSPGRVSRVLQPLALGACALVAPWPTAGVLAALGRSRAALLAVVVGVAAPALGSVTHPATAGVFFASALFWPAGGGPPAWSLCALGLVVVLLGDRGWRGWGIGLSAAVLAGLSPPSVDGLVPGWLPLPLGEGLLVAASAAAPVVGLRWLAARARVGTRLLVGALVVAELVALRAREQLPRLPLGSAWPSSPAMARLAESPGRVALSVYPPTAAETVGWLPFHRQAVRGLPSGVQESTAAPVPGRPVGPALRGALWVRPTPGEASLLSTEIGAPAAVEQDLVLWTPP